MMADEQPQQTEMPAPAAPHLMPSPSLAPLPDMTTCAYCGYLAVGYWRDGGMFVCSECWAYLEEQRAHCPEIEQEAPQHWLDLLAAMALAQ